MTMPSLITKHQEKEFIVKTKKVYSDFNNVLLLIQQENDIVGDNSYLFNATDGSHIVAQNIAKHFNGAKVCTSRTQKGCSQYFYDTRFAALQADDNNSTSAYNPNTPTIILNNGAIIRVSTNGTGCAEKEYTNTHKNELGQTIRDENGDPVTSKYMSANCANIYFDVNGSKAPNQFGRDSYWFWVHRDRVVPNFEKIYGGTSFKNILSGKEKLEYVNYTKGQKLD